ncbi:MAG TPA: hypothetical protein VIH47_01165 [Solirubrobacterales bacterium]
MRVAKGSSSADYATRGTITPTAIHASFGKLGKVALRLRSFRVQHARLPKKCETRGSSAVSEARLGVLAGTFRFRGEGGYTHVSVHRVKGGIGEWPAIFASHRKGAKTIYFCATSAGQGPGPGQPRQSNNAFLDASNPGEAISFFANTEPESRVAAGEAVFIASVSERHGQVKISRAVSASGPATDFLFDHALNTATVAPSAPFTGSANFQRNPDGTASWTGDLATTFLGLGEVGLAGPAFKASLKAE